MSSLYIICHSEDNIQDCISFLQNELNAFIKHQNARIYNARTLYKAEANAKMLEKNARLALPVKAYASCEYVGFLGEIDLETIYSKLFSPTEKNELTYCQHKYYTFSKLKSLLQEFKMEPLENDFKINHFDFRIKYHIETIHDSNMICIICLDIDFVSVNDTDFLSRIVVNLDALFPDVFLSAYLDDKHFHQLFKLQFDIEMLTKRIMNTGKAFYVSNALTFNENINDVAIIQQYDVTHMKNGTWFTVCDESKRMNGDKTQLDNFLLPLYLVVNWSDLLIQNHFPIDNFDMISIFYDKYFPINPTLIFSRGYTAKQIVTLSKEYGDLACQSQYSLSDLLLNS